MKKYLILTVLSMMVFFGNANSFRGDGGKYKYELKRTVEKTFSVKENPILEMDGKYSDFIITTWDQQQIDFKVNIVVKSDNEDKLKAKFNSIDIELEKEGNKVTAETVFGEYNYKTFNGSMMIKYYVQVPADVFMELETKYGDITVETVNKRFEVDIKYGDLVADNLMDISQIDVKYGNINVNYAKKLNLELDYGDAKINKCDELDGELKYSKIFITELGTGNIDNKYSTTRIEKADKVIFENAAYSDLKVSNVTNILDVDMKYSDLSASISSDTPVVDIDGQYSDAVLYINGTASFRYNLESSYSDIIFKGFFDTTKIKGNGTYGEGTPGSLDISTRYGDVKIYKNK